MNECNKSFLLSSPSAPVPMHRRHVLCEHGEPQGGAVHCYRHTGLKLSLNNCKDLNPAL